MHVKILFMMDTQRMSVLIAFMGDLHAVNRQQRRSVFRISYRQS